MMPAKRRCRKSRTCAGHTNHGDNAVSLLGGRQCGESDVPNLKEQMKSGAMQGARPSRTPVVRRRQATRHGARSRRERSSEFL